MEEGFIGPKIDIRLPISSGTNVIFTENSKKVSGELKLSHPRKKDRIIVLIRRISKRRTYYEPNS